MHIAGREQFLDHMCDGLVCPGVAIMSRGHWFSRMVSTRLDNILGVSDLGWDFVSFVRKLHLADQSEAV